MKLTILDGNAVNPGDVSWDLFKKYADITVFPRSSEKEVISRIAESDAVFLNKIPYICGLIIYYYHLK